MYIYVLMDHRAYKTLCIVLSEGKGSTNITAKTALTWRATGWLTSFSRSIKDTQHSPPQTESSLHAQTAHVALTHTFSAWQGRVHRAITLARPANLIKVSRGMCHLSRLSRMLQCRRPDIALNSAVLANTLTEYGSFNTNISNNN